MTLFLLAQLAQGCENEVDGQPRLWWRFPRATAPRDTMLVIAWNQPIDTSPDRIQVLDETGALVPGEETSYCEGSQTCRWEQFVPEEPLAPGTYTFHIDSVYVPEQDAELIIEDRWAAEATGAPHLLPGTPYILEATDCGDDFGILPVLFTEAFDEPDLGLLEVWSEGELFGIELLSPEPNPELVQGPGQAIDRIYTFPDQIDVPRCVHAVQLNTAGEASEPSNEVCFNQPTVDEAGCGCSAAGGVALPWPILLVVLARRRRRGSL